MNSIVGRVVVSRAGAPVQVTVLHLSPAATEALSVGRARLPPVVPATSRCGRLAAGLVVAALLACIPARRACEIDEVCVSEAIVAACFEDLAARDSELRDLKALAAKGLLCIATSEHYSYLLRAWDHPDCAECIEQQTCYAIMLDHACRPDCLREP